MSADHIYLWLAIIGQFLMILSLLVPALLKVNRLSTIFNGQYDKLKEDYKSATIERDLLAKQVREWFVERVK